MRVALVSEVFLPKIDGIVNTLRHLLDHLAARGHDALLVAPAPAPPARAPSTYAGFPVVAVPGVPFPLYPELVLGNPAADLAATLDDFRPDVVHALGPVALGVAGVRYARRRGVPLVASYHTDIPGFAARWKLAPVAPALRAYLHWVHARADVTLCPSRATQRALRADGMRRVRVWGRGVDARRFAPERRDAAMRARLTGGFPDAPLALFVGRLSPEKRADWLVHLLDARPELRLAIVGDGPARPALERAFDPARAVFTGFLDGDELARAYASADLFAFPAANETLGNVVLEAMASGVPVVTADAGGVLEHVVHERTGLTFAASDPSDLVRHASRILDDPALASDLSDHALTHARRCTWAAAHDALLARYAAAMARRVRRGSHAAGAVRASEAAPR